MKAAEELRRLRAVTALLDAYSNLVKARAHLVLSADRQEAELLAVQVRMFRMKLQARLRGRRPAPPSELRQTLDQLRADREADPPGGW